MLGIHFFSRFQLEETDGLLMNRNEGANFPPSKTFLPSFSLAETPLCLATRLSSSRGSPTKGTSSSSPPTPMDAVASRMTLALVNGGALVDFRCKNDGATAVHRAVANDCATALRTLLDLGASPNYKDGRDLTPLYLSVLSCGAPTAAAAPSADLCRMLLHERAAVGTEDRQGWQEIHHVSCRRRRNEVTLSHSACPFTAKGLS